MPASWLGVLDSMPEAKTLPFAALALVMSSMSQRGEMQLRAGVGPSQYGPPSMDEEALHFPPSSGSHLDLIWTSSGPHVDLMWTSCGPPDWVPYFHTYLI